MQITMYWLYFEGRHACLTSTLLLTIVISSAAIVVCIHTMLFSFCCLQEVIYTVLYVGEMSAENVNVTIGGVWGISSRSHWPTVCDPKHASRVLCIFFPIDRYFIHWFELSQEIQREPMFRSTRTSWDFWFWKLLECTLEAIENLIWEKCLASDL